MAALTAAVLAYAPAGALAALLAVALPSSPLRDECNHVRTTEAALTAAVLASAPAGALAALLAVALPSSPLRDESNHVRPGP
jgi:hypothetical protein